MSRNRNGVICECCGRTSHGEDGWVVHPDEGVDLCPSCVKALSCPAAQPDEQRS